MAEQDTARMPGDVLGEVAALLSRGEQARAIECAEAALADVATRADAVIALAAVAFRAQELATAIRLLNSVLDEDAAASDVPELLAVLNALAGRSSEALYYAKLTTIIAPQGQARAVFGPELPQLADILAATPHKPLLAKGRSCMTEGATAAAAALFEQHMELFPNDVEGLDAYSATLAQLGRAEEAIGVLRSVLTLGGPSATLYCRLGCCLTDVGKFEQARACHAEALTRAPKAANLLAEILMDLQRHSDDALPLRTKVGAALVEARAANAPKTKRKPPVATEKEKICVGYLCTRGLSGELRDIVSRTALTHDRATVTTVGFGFGALSLAANVAYRGAFCRWVDISQLDELTLSVIARGEGVDVLVDVDGLMAPSFHHLFARNAAPIQLTWFNYPSEVIPADADGSLADPAVPVGSLLLEPAPIQAPERPSRPIAFTADVDISQLNADVARVWSAILHAVPNATLALYDRGLSQPETTSLLIDLFGNFGVAHRIDVVAQQAPAEFFAEGDIALAPFPTLPVKSYGHALSMGIPVIAMDVGPGRLLANSIRHSGFDAGRMVAATADEYVRQARDWAMDVAALTQARKDAAAIVATSPAFNPASFAAGLERHFRSVLAAKAGA